MLKALGIDLCQSACRRWTNKKYSVLISVLQSTQWINSERIYPQTRVPRTHQCNYNDNIILWSRYCLFICVYIFIYMYIYIIYIYISMYMHICTYLYMYLYFSKLTIKTVNLYQWCCFGVSDSNFEQCFLVYCFDDFLLNRYFAFGN